MNISSLRRIESLLALWAALVSLTASAERVFGLADAGGVPRIAVDGVPFAGTAVMPSPKVPPGTSVDCLRSFAANGIRFSSDIWTMNDPRYTLKQWWLDEGRYDWDLFDRQARGLLDASADGFIFPRIKIDPPAPWLAAHPEDVFSGSVNTASPAWRALYRRMLTDLVDHVSRSDYADRVMGYHIGALRCGEWSVYPFDFSKDLPAATCDPRDPLPPLADIAERDRRIREINAAAADAAIDSATCLRRLTGGRKLIGLFFGYVNFPQEDMIRVIRSDAVDFYAAPPHYGTDRDPGAPARSQAYYQASYRLHGRIFYEETDYRTFLSDPACVPRGMERMRPREEAVSLMRRTVGKCLAGGWENWWFLLGGNDTYSDPKMMETVRLGAAVERETLHTARWRPAQVAVFTSSGDYASSRGTHQMAFRHENKIRLHVEHLPTCGVPFDSYLLDDIADPRLPDYDVYVFPNAYSPSEELRAKIKERVRRPGQTAVWVYAPGYYRHGKGGAENVEDLTGRRVRETYPVQGGLCSRQFAVPDGEVVERDGWRSVFLPQPPDAATLRRVFREAGAHVWLETPDVLAAGRGFVMLHAAQDGEKRLRLPCAADAVEVFGAAPVRKGCTEIVENLRKGETRVYRLTSW